MKPKLQRIVWLAAWLWPLILGAGPLSVSPVVLGGGGGISSSARFQVAGTVAQPVAHTAPLGDARFAGRAGFWSQTLRWLNALPVPVADTVTRRPGEGAHILIGHLLRNDADADWDSLSFVSADAVSANGAAILREGPWLIYRPGAGTALPDTFVYYVTDGVSAPVASTVQLVGFEAPDSGEPNVLAIDAVPGSPNEIRLRFQGIAGRTYRVLDASQVAGPWSELGLATANSLGRVEFQLVPAGGTQFYRLAESP